MAVILMTKRVVVAAGPQLDVQVALVSAPQQLVTAKVQAGPPALGGNQLSHLEAWKLVRAELGPHEPAVVDLFTRFMELVEDKVQHIFISPKAAVFKLRQPRPAVPALIAAPAPDRLTVDAAMHAGELLLHMIPRLPGVGRDSWAYDLGLIAGDRGFEICSLTLVRGDASIYSYEYGLFAAVPESEALAIGVNDLGVNKLKKEVQGQGHDVATLKGLLRKSLERTHPHDVIERYADYAAARKLHKRTPSNEVVVNLKPRHLIGICANLVQLNLSRIGAKRALQLAQVRAEIELISNAVFARVGLRLPAYAYDHTTRVLTQIAALK